MKNIFYVEVDGKEIALKKSGDSFRVVKPYRNKDGTINWFLLLTGGGWKNLIITALSVILILGLLREYAHNINTLLDCFRIPGMLNKCARIYGNNMTILLP